NAATIIEEGFQDSEDLEGIFSGYQGNRKTGTYDARIGEWAYQGTHPPPDEWPDAVPFYRMLKQELGILGHTLEAGSSCHNGNLDELTATAEGGPASDPTLEHPPCVFQILKRHFSRYTHA